MTTPTEPGFYWYTDHYGSLCVAEYGASMFHDDPNVLGVTITGSDMSWPIEEFTAMSIAWGPRIEPPSAPPTKTG